MSVAVPHHLTIQFQNLCIFFLLIHHHCFQSNFLIYLTSLHCHTTTYDLSVHKSLTKLFQLIQHKAAHNEPILAYTAGLVLHFT